MTSKLRTIFASILLLSVVGCANNVPMYQVAQRNVEQLNRALKNPAENMQMV